jgi:hypothetical protein
VEGREREDKNRREEEGRRFGGMVEGEKKREGDWGGGERWMGRAWEEWRKHGRKMRRRVGRIIGVRRTRGLEGGWGEVRDEMEGRCGSIGRKVERGRRRDGQNTGRRTRKIKKAAHRNVPGHGL